MELREVLNIGKPKIIHEGKTKDGETMTILSKFTKAGPEKNRNGRIYPIPLMKREVAKVQKAVESGAFIGTGDHHPSGQATIADASHIIKKLWMEDDGTGWAELKIIPTDRGKNIMTLIRQGAKLGLSTRGFGTALSSGVVQDDYSLTGIDIVTNPSIETAVFNQKNVFESVGFETLKEEGGGGEKPQGSSEEFIQKIMESVWRSQCDFFGINDSFEDWKRKNEAHMRAIIAVQDGLYESEEQALEAMGHHDEARKFLNVQQRVTVQDVAFEAMVAGFDPVEYAKKINASVDEAEAAENLNFSLEERQRIFAEAQRAGVDVSDPKERKRVLKIYDRKILDEDEKLEAEARRIQEDYKREYHDKDIKLESIKSMLKREREEKEKEEIERLKIQSRLQENFLAGAPPITKKGE
jgi:hypothetical protein